MTTFAVYYGSDEPMIAGFGGVEIDPDTGVATIEADGVKVVIGEAVKKEDGND